MHAPRRRKKRPAANLKSVEVSRGRGGYGFTLSGQVPCMLSCIVSGSPAERAGLRPGDYVMAVNGENVAKLPHEIVVRMIGGCKGILRLSIAQRHGDDSESSEDEWFATRPGRPGRDRSAGRYPNVSRAEKVVEDIVSGALFASSPQTQQLLSPLAPVTHFTSEIPEEVNRSNGQDPPPAVRPKAPRVHPSGMASDSSNYDGCNDSSRDQHLRRSRSQPSMNEREDKGRTDQEGEAWNPAMSPDLRPEEVACIEADQEHCFLRVIVGYLGSIEMPREGNSATVSMQNIRSCVRRLRMEQRIHTLVLMEVREGSVRLRNNNGETIAIYPVERLAFSGVFPDDKRFFGLVTTRGLDEESCYAGSEDERSLNVGTSCHVFMVDPEISAHNIHAQRAQEFSITCTTNPETGGCEEFPRSARPLLRTVGLLYGERGNDEGTLTREIEMARWQAFPDQDAFHAPPRRSNSNSSNSDSGIGYWKEEGYRVNNDSVYVVDLSSDEYGMMQVRRPNAQQQNRQPVRGAEGPQNRGTENSPTSNGLANGKHSKLSPRVRTDIPPHLNLSQRRGHQGQASFQNRTSPSQNSHGPARHPSAHQSRPRIPPSPSPHVEMWDQLVQQQVGRMRDARAYNYSSSDSNSPIKDRPPPIPPRRGPSARPQGSNSNRQKGAPSSGKAAQPPRMQNSQQTQSHESLAVSDGEVARPHGASGKLHPSSSVSSLASNTSTHSVPEAHVAGAASATATGRVASWAVSFDRLLHDPAGLACFTEFLKQEYSEENIVFWTECEKFKAITDQQEMVTQAQVIYSTHMSSKASMPVNIDSQARQMVDEMLGSPAHDMFNLAQQQIFQLMKFDSYSRFLKSPLYQDCMLCDVEGRPLPYDLASNSGSDADDTASKSSKESRGQKLWRKVRENAVDLTGDGTEKKRRSLLPWARGKHSKRNMKFQPDVDRRSSKGGSSGSVQVLDGHLSDNSSSRRSSLASTDLDVLHQKAMSAESLETSQLNESAVADPRQSYKFCRVLLPDGSSTVIYAKPGQTIRSALSKLCERRQLPMAAVEVYHLADDKPVDLEQDVSVLGSKEIRVEQRVLFKLDLPSLGKFSLRVKVKPTKPVAEVMRTVLNKYSLRLEEAIIRLDGNALPLDLGIPAATLENQKVIVEPTSHVAGTKYSVPGKLPLQADTRHLEPDRTSSSYSLVRRNTTGTEEITRKSKDGGNSTSNGQSSDRLPRKTRPVQGSDTEGKGDLFMMLSRASRSRMEDQRGASLSNLELPDFLKPKKSGQDSTSIGTNKSNPSSADSHRKSSMFKDMYEVPEFLREGLNSTNQSFSGVYPSQVQADHYFKGHNADDSFLPNHSYMDESGNMSMFNDSAYITISPEKQRKPRPKSATPNLSFSTFRPDSSPVNVRAAHAAYTQLTKSHSEDSILNTTVVENTLDLSGDGRHGLARAYGTTDLDRTLVEDEALQDRPSVDGVPPSYTNANSVPKPGVAYSPNSDSTDIEPHNCSAGSESLPPSPMLPSPTTHELLTTPTPRQNANLHNTSNNSIDGSVSALQSRTRAGICVSDKTARRTVVSTTQDGDKLRVTFV
ncbi:PREDICTED: regulator of G-protein signaling loco-like isoform X2 [Branchiostoma belcheri]|uniref:Regulator of G-protein signaling loco-like isoform X1 n=1 Tax=Branchiostoma belcheri TaxID=7741 RepID=A0A6P5A4I6_BRABE|nr:PREDICTED: regulator of G-protein signaling loco-like isoform X1 [Branchiostoma belcheri]XP_019644400.1 PREDICTED: regulator of G-protein signaling loco-like isoform X2 [Branchiostoma belcheri]